MGRQHGSIAQAGKVRANTPKVPKQEKPKGVCGRAHIRKNYNKRFLAVNPDSRKSLKPNSNA